MLLLQAYQASNLALVATQLRQSFIGKRTDVRFIQDSEAAPKVITGHKAGKPHITK